MACLLAAEVRDALVAAVRRRLELKQQAQKQPNKSSVGETASSSTTTTTSSSSSSRAFGGGGRWGQGVSPTAEPAAAREAARRRLGLWLGSKGYDMDTIYKLFPLVGI